MTNEQLFLDRITSSFMQQKAPETFTKAKKHPIEITRQPTKDNPAETYIMMTADYFEGMINRIK